MTSIVSGIIGMVLGIILKYIFDSKYFRDQKTNERESQAYIDYMLAVALSAKAQSSKNQEDNLKAGVAAIDAKSRICIYGHAKVAEALSEFEKLGAALVNDEQIQSYIVLIKEMRKRSCNYAALSDEIMKLNLFGSKKLNEKIK